MRRGKPQQQLYRPGSGPLRKSTQGIEESESDTNLLVNPRQYARSTQHDDAKFKSEGCSPREKVTALENQPSHLGDNSQQRRPRKPEQMLFVPRVIAQAREQMSNTPREYEHDSNMYNGNGRGYEGDRLGNRSKRYSQRRREADSDHHEQWREKSPSMSRHSRQVSEPRGMHDDPGWQRNRDRDTRSVEPTSMSSRNFNSEKIQAKPPSGRRHSTIGLEQDKRHKLENLPPRFRKKYLEEQSNQSIPVTPEETSWDGSSLTFQGHPQHKNNPSFHQMGGAPYNSAPPPHNPNPGYYTLPNRARGRGRLQHEYEAAVAPPGVYRPLTPDRPVRSPCGSRPPTPPLARMGPGGGSRPHTPVGLAGPYEEPARAYPDQQRGVQERLNAVRRGEPKHVLPAVTNLLNNYEKERALREEHRVRDEDHGRRNRDEDQVRRNRDEDHGRRNRDEDHGRRNRDEDHGRRNRDEDHGRRNRDEDRGRRNRGGRNRKSSSRDRNRRDRRSTSREFRRDSNTSNISSVATLSNSRSIDITCDEVSTEQLIVQEKTQEATLAIEPPVEETPLEEFHDAKDEIEEDEIKNGEITPTPAETGQEAPLSPVSASSPEETPIERPKPSLCTNLDWNEEIELDRLENGALSDALTRSSSVTSLQDISVKSTPAMAGMGSLNPSSSSSSRSKKRSSRSSKSKKRGSAAARDPTPPGRRQPSTDPEFKRPEEPHGGGGRRRRRSRGKRDNSFERFHNKSRNASRDVSFDRKGHSGSECENWREEILRSRKNSERDDVIYRQKSSDHSERGDDLRLDKKKAGILILPPKTSEPPARAHAPADQPRCPDVKRVPSQSKALFDPNNPNRPILVQVSGGRVSVPGFSDTDTEANPPQMDTGDQFGNTCPVWYDEATPEFRTCHFPNLLRDIRKADRELQGIIDSGALLVNWGNVDSLRQFLKEALEYLLCRSIKFCELANVEHHLWKILYYNIIEITRKVIQNDPDNKANFKSFLLYLIDEGTKYFEGLLKLLEDTYKFKLNNYLGGNSMLNKGVGLVSLALTSAQKIYLFLGDLGRYREQVNETSSYGKCRQWYIKSHEINPRNGKPYNQLAILAVYSRRKLDAVYYYMRSLMSSNPVPAARENLGVLFDENRKKYEQSEKKRREERLERQRQQMRQKESEETNAPNSLRRETWIHPEGGRRLHLTTQALQEERDSEEEDLAALSSVEVNKRFVTSYLHVHSKLITKIGMETFPEAAMQMLKEFRALLQHSPVPLPCNRVLQLLALNMFAIESTQLKDLNLQSGTSYRSELQERALVVSLQMFNLILERCVGLLDEHIAASQGKMVDVLPPDVNVLLPAIKIWCDWMLSHRPVWDPPPSTQDFRVGTPGDAWSRLAHLMNLLEKIDQTAAEAFINEPKEGYEPVRLPEDTALVGFTPLAYAARQEPTFAPKEADPELSQLALRLSKLLFFGTVYLCGLERPVLKLELRGDGGISREYVSVVSEGGSSRGSGDGESSPAELVRNKEILLEDFSGDEETEEIVDVNTDVSSEVHHLRTRKLELERKKRNQDLHRERVMKILSQSVVSVHLVVKPKYLVPDTNCFIDHLDTIQTIAQTQCYTIMVPIIVLSELEGLSKGAAGAAPAPTAARPAAADALQHAQRVAAAARAALDYLRQRHAAVKCVTTRGTVIASASFSTEEDGGAWDAATLTNDDKILTTCLALCKDRAAGGGGGGGARHDPPPPEHVEGGEPRQLSRDVVLLTEDRNLRVKAHARDLPTRALPDFARWAGLGG